MDGISRLAPPGIAPMAAILFFSPGQALWWFGTILIHLSVTMSPLRAGDLVGTDEFETLQAREVLLADDELRSLNLGVTVRRHVAMLWGTVPSKKVSLRAEIRLRTMLPLTDVCNDLVVVEERILLEEGTTLAAPLPLVLPETIRQTAPSLPTEEEETPLTPPSP